MNSSMIISLLVFAVLILLLLCAVLVVLFGRHSAKIRESAMKDTVTGGFER